MLTLTMGAAAAGGLMGSQPSADPEGQGGGPAPGSDYSERHQDFSRGSVHLVGAIEGVLFAERHNLDDARRKFLEATVKAAEALLDRHEGFPPHPSALNDPGKIARWQDAMSKARAAARAIANSSGQGKDAVKSTGELLEAWREAGEHSGYPAGTIAFLEWRGVHKMARDIDPDLRIRFVEEIVQRLGDARDRFVAERRPLMPVEELAEFDQRVQSLLDQQVESVRKPGPIPASIALTLHKLYPAFHHPDILAPLLEREEDR